MMPTPGPSRTAVIFGGTDGLGCALAVQYLQSGWRVVVVGRTDRRNAADAAAIFLHLDLADAIGLATIQPKLAEAGIEAIDCLIHCAGIGWVGPPSEQTAASIDAMVMINTWSPIAIARLLTPLVERAEGRVVFIGSIAAFVPAPRYAVYAATKAAIDGFARSFMSEMSGRIIVQVIHPGPIRTAFHERAEARDVDGTRFPTPAAVADRVLNAMQRPGWRHYPNAMTALIAVAATLAYGWIDRLIAMRERRTHQAIQAEQAPASSAIAPVALITGSSSGLGAALTDQLLTSGYRVLGVDIIPAQAMVQRNPERFQLIAANIAAADGIEQIANIAAMRGRIDLLVHCAGTSDVGPFESRALDRLDQVLKTNLTGPMKLTARLLHDRLLCDRARVVFVSSLSHFVGYPGAAVYAASKDGLAHYARSIGLGANGPSCLTVFPGPMRTPHAVQFAPTGADDRHRVDPRAVAKKILAALARRRSRLVVGRGARLAMIVGLIAPRLATMIMRRTLFARLRDAPRLPDESVPEPELPKAGARIRSRSPDC